MDTVVADHYVVLGVAPDAASEQIQQAFRRRSKQCHPDMGGTEAEMMAVIEAWEVLKDPERRAAFDRARGRPWDQAAAAELSRAEGVAAAQAKAYPRAWADFERWVDAMLGDVTRAEYGETSFGPFGGLPTAVDSLSGFVFILIGGWLGFGIFVSFDWYSAFVSSVLDGKPQVGGRPVPMAIPLIVLAALPPIAGAWAGRYLHQVLRDYLRRTKASRVAERQVSSSAASPFMLRCPHCQQQLRLPRADRVMDVTCPKCRSKFGYTPEGASAAETAHRAAAASPGNGSATSAATPSHDPSARTVARLKLAVAVLSALFVLACTGIYLAVKLGERVEHATTEGAKDAAAMS